MAAPAPDHRVYVQNPSPADGLLTVAGPEAHHAVRAKRVRPGEAVEVLDGAGRVLSAEVAAAEPGREPALVLRVLGERFEDPVRPAVSVWSALPKGDRAEAMIDALSQVGATSWSPLRCERAVAELTARKRHRLERAAIESAKQSGRAWFLSIGDETTLSAAAPADSRIVLALADAHPYQPNGGAAVRILIGPEGGWTQGEIDAALRAGATPAAFGPHIMRIETAAVAAAAIVLNASR